MIVGVWFTKPVVLCAAMGEVLRRTASAECKEHTRDIMSVLQCVLQCRQHTSDVMTASIVQAFVFV